MQEAAPTLPSGISTKAAMSLSSTLPNLPICPCSFRPAQGEGKGRP